MKKVVCLLVVVLLSVANAHNIDTTERCQHTDTVVLSGGGCPGCI